MDFIYNYITNKSNQLKQLSVYEDEKIPKISFKYFKFINNQFFSNTNYHKLPLIKKRFFSSEIEYEDIKFDFQNLKFKYNMLAVGYFSLFTYINYKTINFVIARSIKNRRFIKKSKHFIAITSSIVLTRIILNRSLTDLNTVLTVDKFFGLYLWFEIHYRLDTLTDTALSNLESYQTEQQNFILNDRFIDLSRFNQSIGYYTLKNHYIKMERARGILKHINTEYKYNNVTKLDQYSDTNQASFLGKMRKFLSKEYKKLYINEDRLKEQLKFINLDESNYSQYISDDAIILLKLIDIERQAFINKFI